MMLGAFGRSIAEFSARRLERGADVSWFYRRPSLFYPALGGMTQNAAYHTNSSFHLALRIVAAGEGTSLRTERLVRYFSSLSGQNLMSFYKSLSQVFHRAERMTYHTQKKEKSLGDLYFEMSRFQYPLRYAENTSLTRNHSSVNERIYNERAAEVTVVERSAPSEPTQNINAILKSAMEMFRSEMRSQRARRGMS